jgi:cytochrome c553
VWEIWDGGVMSRRATDLAEDDARQQAADLNVTSTSAGNATKIDPHSRGHAR